MKYYIEKSEQKHLDLLVDFYEKVLDFLVSTVNYPKWTQAFIHAGRALKMQFPKGSSICVWTESALLGHLF